MISFVYLITEGVHDVAFLGKLLRVCHGATRVGTMDELDAPRRAWMGSFKWPQPGSSGQIAIDRLSVPAPVFYRLPSTFVALRNADGISNIYKTLERDLESFERGQGAPDAIAVVLDSDDAPAEKRFQELAQVLRKVNLSPPTTLGEVTTAAPRVGVFALPEPGKAGTIEDLFLGLGDIAYPQLSTAARAYANDWRKKAETELKGPEWREIKKAAGAKKATIGAMIAILKPGKPTQASIDDHRWVSDETKALPILQPCLSFLQALLATAPAAPVETAP